MTFELWELILVFALGIWAGRNIQVWLTAQSMINNPRAMIRLLERLAAEGLDDQTDEQIELIAEVNHGEIYLYRKDTLEFMGQGRSIEEIVGRWPARGTGPAHYRISKQTAERIQAELPK
jgi:hypothetical protein